MWTVRLTEQRMPYGPFDDEQEAQRFADYLTAEVDPAVVERLCSPVAELLAWRDHVKDKPARPSVRGGPDIGAAADHDYRHQEQNDRD